MLCRIEIIDICIQYKERIGVPQRAHKLTLTFHNRLAAVTLRNPGSGYRIEIPAVCICAVFFQSFEGIHRIAFGLTHLLTIFIENVTHNDNVFKRRAVKQQRRFRHQRVKPASCLVNSLGNELCRELSLKYVLIFKGIMMLCKGHCAGVKPAVDYFGNTVHGAAALRALHCDLVDIRTMQLYSQRLFVAGFFKQLLTAADGFHMSAGALPYVQRSSPVTVSGNTPVLYVFQPVAETSFTDGFRNPVYSIVICNQFIADCRHADEPGFSCVVDQGRVASPAVRIAVLKLRSRKQQVRILQSLQDKGICFLYKYTRPGSFFGHIAFTVYQLYERKIIFSAYVCIVFTECRCDMNHAGTICQGNVRIAGYIVGFLILFFTDIHCTVKQRLIRLVFQIFTCVGFQHFIGGSFRIFRIQLAKNSIQQSFCHIIGIAVSSFYLAVCFVRIYAECNVGGQGPRRGCPCQEISIFADYLEANDCRTFLDILIALRNLLCRQRCSAARTVGNDLKAFV